MSINIIEQLTIVYNNYELWHKDKLSKEESEKYFEKLIIQGNILTYVVKDKLIGYLEYYRINYEQFGRICCNWTLTHDEDILNGNISLINRMWINENYRNGEAFDMLTAMYLTKNKDAEFFTTIQRHKHHKPLQVYSKEDVFKYYKKGELYG